MKHTQTERCLCSGVRRSYKKKSHFNLSGHISAAAAAAAKIGLRNKVQCVNLL